MITKAEVDNWFTHHPATPSNAGNYLQLRESGRHLAMTIINLTPPGPDQSDAIRKVREAVMIANASIACSGG